MSIPARNSDPLHIVADQRTFFVSSSTWGKRSLLQCDSSAALFIRNIYEYREQSKYLLHAFVVMPDHFHLLITLNAGMSVERAVQFVKGGFAFHAGKELGFHPPVWQKGFSEKRIFSMEAFVAAREYIHQNPVKRGLIVSSGDYPYSSAGARFVVDAPPQRLKPLFRDAASGIAKAMP